MAKEEYAEFLRAKVAAAPALGFPCAPEESNPILKPHQRDMVGWAVRGGRRALFASFGLGKSVMQIEIVRLVLAKTGGGRGLIVCPLGVRPEFFKDAAMLGVPLTFVRDSAEATGNGIYLTNFESVREGKIDTRLFQVVSIDEAAILRGFGGTKTFREFMAVLAGDDRRTGDGAAAHEVKYRFVATAVPSPNEYLELLAYAHFLGVMDIGQAKTRFFKRDSEHADNLTLQPHMEAAFWAWVASWALFVEKPSDLGHSDEGYALPPLKVVWHELPTDHRAAGHERDGQGKLLKDAALGVVDASREKRGSLPARVAKVGELLKGSKDQAVVWCDLNDEQSAIEDILAARKVKVSSLTGSDSVEEREARLQAWKDRETRVFLSKPSMYGAGVNLQQAHVMVFAGIGFRFSEVIQAIHRIHRFLQTQPCVVHLVYTEAEREVRRVLEDKWAEHERLVAAMTALLREHGIVGLASAAGLTRTLGVARREEKGGAWTVAHNDCVEETKLIASDSLGLVLTSVPFATQYEYSPSYNDFGHTDNIPHFFQQMDYLTPELYRALKPGRLAAIHVKDRITPTGLTGLGFQCVEPFSDAVVAHYRAHGFGFLARITIVTDVVRENAQTYRLGWSEQCKDGTRMGNGLPEYLLIFRKPPTDRSRGYADEPVVKSKDVYTRARWQFDAHGLHRSSGDRLLIPDDLKGMTSAQVYQAFRKHSATAVYDFEHDVRLAEALDAAKMLPPSFMLLQPDAHAEHVWTDVARMRTLNSTQAQKGLAQHLCPLPFDIVDRAIAQYTNPGDEVYDPFGGLMTVPLCAVRAGRRGRGTELNQAYFADGVWHLRRQDEAAKSPTLFDITEQNAAAGGIFVPTKKPILANEDGCAMGMPQTADETTDSHFRWPE